MAREFPDWIDPWKAAEGRRIFSGSIALSSFERLRPLLAANVSGEAAFKARFRLDSQRRAQVDIEVMAELPLICQVSLEAYSHRIQRFSRLTVIENEMDQLELPEDHEATCAQEGRVSLAGLVEDECILAMPEVPRRPGLSFRAETEAEELPGRQDTYKPFAELGKLLKSSGDGQDSGNR